MSGHSKWSTIKHKKAAKDAKRGKLFTKLIKEITVAARLGGGDISGNPRLRTAVATARENSLPSENIERAIKRGTGELEGVNYEEVQYEGYGPGGVAILCNAMTDNRNRTVADLRRIFDKSGGNMGAAGCVAWMFSKRGLITVEHDKIDEERLIELALDAGADDVKDAGDVFEIVTAPDAFDAVRAALQAATVPLRQCRGHDDAAERRVGHRQGRRADPALARGTRRPRRRADGGLQRRHPAGGAGTAQRSVRRGVIRQTDGAMRA